jgi:hypothetical protein
MSILFLSFEEIYKNPYPPCTFFEKKLKSLFPVFECVTMM